MCVTEERKNIHSNGRGASNATLLLAIVKTKGKKSSKQESESEEKEIKQESKQERKKNAQLT